MLTIFNRTVVYTTYSQENLNKVKEKENISYLIRCTKSKYDELGEAYQFYVHADQVDQVQRLISEVLFPNTSNL